jgi:Family of unknown function (DUF5712)
MPYVKPLAVNSKTNNASGCSLSVNYLEKEDKGKSILEKEGFFNDRTDFALGKQVELDINRNKQGLSKGDSKYYEVVISFSKEELKGKTDKELKEFVKKEFPKAYTSAISGREIDEKSLTWYGKLERERKYKGTDEEVKQGKAKSGQLKEGDNRHIHLLIARKTSDNKYKISPLNVQKNGSEKAASKGGYDRVKLAESVEKSFDKHFKYERKQEETLEYKLDKKNGIEQKPIEKEAVKEITQEKKQQPQRNLGL